MKYPPKRNMLRRWLAGMAVAAAMVSATPAQAQDWARKMFDKTTHDFGSVARGAKVECRFTIENIYEENAHIKAVTSSCQCSKPKIAKQSLKTWEKTEVSVTVDTRAEPGQKDGTIEVEFDQPFPAKVQLHVHSYIRRDVVVQPGVVQFGSVDQSAGATRDLNVLYAIGRNDWKILRVECANPNIEAKAVETARTESQVAYNLSVRLKPGAPAGYIQEPLVLVTNDFDPQKARVPVSVEGLVAAAFTVRPSSLSLGMAEVGKPVTSNLVVQGRAPFRILAIKTNDERFQSKVPADTKAFHILPVTFLAKDASTASGKVKAKLRIETDLAGTQPIEVEVSAQIITEK